jgi:queuosine precursor transporter
VPANPAPSERATLPPVDRPAGSPGPAECKDQGNAAANRRVDRKAGQELGSGALPKHLQPTRFGVSRADALLLFFASLFCVVLVLTNMLGTKLFVVHVGSSWTWLFGSPSITLTTGLLSYPITFLVTDLVSEIWGRKKADYMVFLGLFASLAMLAFIQLARVLPPSPLWSNPDPERFGPVSMQSAFLLTFSFPGTLLFASMLAYMVAQLLDVRLYHFWWRATGGRHLWLRNNGSTLISQLVDTIIVNVIFLRLALDLPWGAIAAIIWATYLFKAAMALADTPFMYLGRSWIRRYLGLPNDEAPLRAPLAD